MEHTCWVFQEFEYDAARIAKRIAPYVQAKKGQKVFIKPNWVIDPWPGEEEDWISTVTHPVMVEAVLMVLQEKMEGTGEIIVGDAPMTRTKIDVLLKRMDMTRLIARYNQGDFHVSQIDIRKYYWHHVANMCVKRIMLPGDPAGSVRVNLGEDSMFSDKQKKTYMETDTVHPVSEFHSEATNAYEMSKSILSCDVFINLPKLKTHRLAGLTCALKNLVGSISNKNCVPHSTLGSDKEGGDCFPHGDKDAMNGHGGIRGAVDWITKKKIPAVNYLFIPVKVVYDKLFAKKYSQKKAYGAWHGNDTIWRSVLDLNRILLYCDKTGTMHDTLQRNYLCITDAIIAGEKEGPLHPTPKRANLILISENPVALDATACCLMGFDWEKIPVLKNAFFANKPWPLADFKMQDILIKSNVEHWNNPSLENLFEADHLHFIPSAGWQGTIERQPNK